MLSVSNSIPNYQIYTKSGSLHLNFNDKMSDTVEGLVANVTAPMFKEFKKDRVDPLTVIGEAACKVSCTLWSLVDRGMSYNEVIGMWMMPEDVRCGLTSHAGFDRGDVF